MIITLSGTTPAAPAGRTNVEWQSDGQPNPRFSASVKTTAPQITGVDVAPVTLASGRAGVILTFNGSVWVPAYPEPYRVQEAHADMSGNTPGMYTGSSYSFRWATNGAQATYRVDASASERMLFQMETFVSAGAVCLFGNNQSLHLPYTLGNLKDFRARVGLVVTTSERFYVGISDWAAPTAGSVWNSNAPAQNFVGFCFSSTTDANFMCVCQTDATHQTRLSSGVPVDTAMHVFEFYHDGSAVQFYIDGVNVGSISTNLPATSVKMDMIALINATTSTSRKLNMDFVALYQ